MEGRLKGGRRDARKGKGGSIGFLGKGSTAAFLTPSSFYLCCHIFQCLKNLSTLIDPWPIIILLLPPLAQFHCSAFVLYINLCSCLYPHFNKKATHCARFSGQNTQKCFGVHKHVYFLYGSDLLLCKQLRRCH